MNKVDTLVMNGMVCLTTIERRAIGGQLHRSKAEKWQSLVRVTATAAEYCDVRV